MTASALLVIDMQRDVMITCPTADTVLATVNELGARARSAGAPVVLVRQQDDELVVDTDGWQLDSRLVHDPTDHVVDKRFRDAFAATGLTELLQRLGADHVVVCGAHSDYCVQTSALAALAQGFDVTLVADGHAAEPTSVAGTTLDADVLTALVNARMATMRYPGRRVAVAAAADVAWDR